MAFYPRDGVHLINTRDGRLVQKTVWRHEKLVAAWEYEQRGALPLEVIAAVNRGERDWPAPRWIQVVKKGAGRLTYFDADGNNIGFADYQDGEYYRGAH
jgi:hypothetical protein